MLNRSQRRLVQEIMSLGEEEGFVIAGGIALNEAHLSTRPTDDLDIFTTNSDLDVPQFADTLTRHLQDSGHHVQVTRTGSGFVQVIIATGRFRRSSLKLEVGHDVRLFAPVDSGLGPMISPEESAANKILAAFGRSEPRDLCDLHSLSGHLSIEEAIANAKRKDPGFHDEYFYQQVQQTCAMPDSEWPEGVDIPDVRALAMTIAEHVRGGSDDRSGLDQALHALLPPPTASRQGPTADLVFVPAYRRSDGTFVRGHYRRRR